MFSRASLMEGWTRDETGSCCAVKGDVDACDPPPEARVPRLDRCCSEQKVGYGRHATRRLSPASRDSSSSRGGAKRFRASVEIFFSRSESSELPSTPFRGDSVTRGSVDSKNIRFS